MLDDDASEEYKICLASSNVLLGEDNRVKRKVEDIIAIGPHLLYRSIYNNDISK